jgi:nicotinamide mononucleotide adenylyltransferase
LLAAWQGLGNAEAGIDLPASPQTEDAGTLDALRAALDARIAQLEARLAAAAGTLRESLRADLDALLAAGASMQEQLAAYAAQARLHGAAPDTAAEREQTIARILARAELDTDAPLPAALDALAQQITAAPSRARAEALATELRLQVQRHNEARSAARAAAEQRELQEAAAVVLEQSLADLGYAVEEIGATLFVEGGVAHFQRPGWGDYFIRLRIDPKRKAMNFNVVRAGTAGEDRQREDMLAEERWCSEFPKLFETLKARGIPIAVTRLLQAGEAPVQVVDAASLPARAEEERRHQPLQARSIA